MGLSRLQALQIQANETLVDSYKDREFGKYGYAITHNEERYCRPIVSCNPVYDSKADALTAGKELMEKIKGMDLEPDKRALVNAVGGTETAKTIDKIVERSKGGRK